MKDYPALLFDAIVTLTKQSQLKFSRFIVCLNNIIVLFNSIARYIHTAKFNFGWLVTFKAEHSSV